MCKCIIANVGKEIKLKPWGREIWFAKTKNYAGKILEVKKGKRLSLQFHDKKEETQFLFSGKVLLTIGKTKDNLREKVLLPGDVVDIKPGVIHRIKAIEDSIIFEVSTPELDDVVKLEDDFGRSGRGNNEELDKKLAGF